MESKPAPSPQEEARHMQVMADFDEAMRQEEARISKRKAADHFTSCRDCGKFTGKDRWVERNSVLAARGQRPLCVQCFDEYDWGGW